jgi:Fe2+ transport system protein B
MFVSALFPSHLQATVLFGIYAAGILLALLCARLLKNTFFKTVQRDAPHRLKRLRIPSLRKVGLLMWSRAFMYVRKAGTFILGASIILWFLNTYPRPEEGTAENAAAAMEHSYAGQIGHWMEPVTRVAGFDWKVNSALLGAFAAKEIFVTQMGILYAVQDGDSGPEAQQTLNTRLKASYTPLQGISIMIFCLIALPCIGTVTVAKREAGTWWFALAQFAGLTVMGFVTATVVYQVGLLL